MDVRALAGRERIIHRHPYSNDLRVTPARCGDAMLMQVRCLLMTTAVGTARAGVWSDMAAYSRGGGADGR